jgi:hypothetical protein
MGLAPLDPALSPLVPPTPLVEVMLVTADPILDLCPCPCVPAAEVLVVYAVPPDTVYCLFGGLGNPRETKAALEGGIGLPREDIELLSEL